MHTQKRIHRRLWNCPASHRAIVLPCSVSTCFVCLFFVFCLFADGQWGGARVEGLLCAYIAIVCTRPSPLLLGEWEHANNLNKVFCCHLVKDPLPQDIYDWGLWVKEVKKWPHPISITKSQNPWGFELSGWRKTSVCFQWLLGAREEDIGNLGAPMWLLCLPLESLYPALNKSFTGARTSLTFQDTVLY